MTPPRLALNLNTQTMDGPAKEYLKHTGNAAEVQYVAEGGQKLILAFRSPLNSRSQLSLPV